MNVRASLIQSFLAMGFTRRESEIAASGTNENPANGGNDRSSMMDDLMEPQRSGYREF
jgi:hypothetical protein